MRTLIDIEEADLKRLEAIAKDAGRSRASVMREAISEYLDRRKPAGFAEAFGLWANQKVDGLAYQEKLRGEW